MPMITGSEALADACVDAHHERDSDRTPRVKERIVRSRSSILTGRI